MDPFSIGVGAVTTIDLCLKYGPVLIKLFEDHTIADLTISEALLKLKAIWNKTEMQMTFLRNVWDTLPANFQTNQVLLLANLERKLHEAIRLLNGVIGTDAEIDTLTNLLTKRGPMRKNKYVLHVKDSLDKTLSELVEWHGLFDPSWFLLSRAPSSGVDQSLRSSPQEGPLKLLSALRKCVRDLNADTNMPPRAISSRDFLGPRFAVAASSVATAEIEGRVQHVIVDTMLLNANMDSTGTTHSVMALTKALSRMDPSSFGLLRCCGVINKTDRYELVFEVPRGLEAPRSLRDLLLNSQPSLNMKLALAKQLANSVFYLHAAGFVHKNIRPETILVFDRGSEKSSFLFGFENFRAAKGDTFKIGDSLPEREIYRHPLRQGNDPERRYVMQHDIYSLGVCLLEIGIWESFVQTKENAQVVRFEQVDAAKDPRKSAFGIKRQVLLLASERLAQCTGERFKDVVESCLACLDDDAVWSHVDDKSEPEVDVGVEFIENVLLQLQEIVV